MSFIEKAVEMARKARQEEAAPDQVPTGDAVRGLPPDAEPLAPEEEIKELVYSLTRTVPVQLATMLRHRLLCSGLNPEVVESYKLLRTHILQKTQDQDHRVLMVTSPVQGEGKTLTAINLSLSLAQELAKTVLLVDVDLRHPTIPSYFGFEAEYGLVDYLEGRKNIPELLVHPQGIDRLVILPAGKPTEWAAELIRSPRMQRLVPELKNFYRDRYVICDLPPLLAFADALAFAPLADGIILVVEARHTSRIDLHRCQEMLKDRNIIGYVLNKAAEESQNNYYKYKNYRRNGRPAKSWWPWRRRQQDHNLEGP